MSNSPLENKTVRPGSLQGYSYYYSKNQMSKTGFKAKQKKQTKKSRGTYKVKFILFLLVAILAIVAIRSIVHTNNVKVNQASKTKNSSATPPLKPTPALATTNPTTNNCVDNTLSKRVIVSISQRHLWACQQNTVANDSSVVTGISYIAADMTPLGTYHVYEKATNTNLVGADSTGSWNDYVYYWMPFLRNQYGIYGFHDATWRANSEFGNISPDSANASHGCVELPLATAKWLYNWVDIGTAVTIEN